MRVIDLTMRGTLPGDTPLPVAAMALAVRRLAAAWKIALPEDAIVLVTSDGPAGDAIAETWSAPGERVWVANDAALERVLHQASETELRSAGLVPHDSFERDAAKLVRRRLAHFPPEQLEAVLGLLPRLAELAGEFDPPYDD